MDGKMLKRIEWNGIYRMLPHFFLENSQLVRESYSIVVTMPITRGEPIPFEIKDNIKPSEDVTGIIPIGMIHFRLLMNYLICGLENNDEYTHAIYKSIFKRYFPSICRYYDLEKCLTKKNIQVFSEKNYKDIMHCDQPDTTVAGTMLPTKESAAYFAFIAAISVYAKIMGYIIDEEVWRFLFSISLGFKYVDKSIKTPKERHTEATKEAIEYVKSFANPHSVQHFMAEDLNKLMKKTFYRDDCVPKYIDFRKCFFVADGKTYNVPKYYEIAKEFVESKGRNRNMEDIAVFLATALLCSNSYLTIADDELMTNLVSTYLNAVPKFISDNWVIADNTDSSKVENDNEDVIQKSSLEAQRIMHDLSEAKKWKPKFDALSKQYAQKEDMSRKVEDLENELMVAKRELASLRTFAYEQTEKETPKVDDVTTDTACEYLKDKKIVIVGGSDNWTNKLKQVFPLWTFPFSGVDNISIVDDAYAVYFFTGFLSHKMYTRFYDRCVSCDKHTGFISCVNKDRVIMAIYDDLRSNMA